METRPMRALRLALLAAALLAASPVRAPAQIPDNTLRVGILNDQSGPFADQTGRGSLVAAELAAEDFAKEAGGLKVALLYGDHQNKPDIGAAIAREWVDRQGVAAVADVPNSAVGLAVSQVMREKHRTYLASSTATSDLTGRACAPTTVQWVLDTWALGNAAARGVTAEGGDSWFFISFDYALGRALERDTSEALARLGAKVLGAVRHPLGTTDFSSYLLQAQGSGAKVVALGDTGVDFVNVVKQAAEFGLTPRQRLVGLFTQIMDVDAIGLAQAQGLFVVEAFYWDLDENTRAFARRFAERMGGRMPGENHAGVYSSVLAWLRAARDAGTIEGERVVERMRAAPIEDRLFGTVTIRPDGRAVHAMHVFRVKAPAESRARWDDYRLVATIPAAEAFRPLGEGGCPLVTGR